ncbi:MAG: DNA adenine methylase [Asticcacaulis sp.]
MNELSPVKPVLPIAPYIGGKRNLARKIIGLIEQVPHDTYAEPFVGMGGVFFRRERRPRAEVINDYSADVANLFRVLKHHRRALIEDIRWQISSREAFEWLRAQDPNHLTDIQRAGRFLYLQRLAFSGKVNGRHFGVQTGRAAAFNPLALVAKIDSLHERLAGVMIERLAWSDFVRRYDRAGTLFYLDPPYYGCEDDYGKDLFSRDQFEQMAEQLSQIKGRFILSLNDKPEVRRIFSGFDIEAVPVRYTISGAGGGEFREVIIRN